MLKQSKRHMRHNYLQKLHHLWRTGALPRDAGLHLIDVAHDDWCGIFDGKRCNCDPDIKLKRSLGRNTH